jgi:hypothetical protein
MLLDVGKERFHKKPSETDLKLEHVWHTLRDQPKWYARHDDDDSSDRSKRSHLNLDDDCRFTSLESVSALGPIGHDRERSQHKEKRPTTSTNDSKDVEQVV